MIKYLGSKRLLAPVLGEIATTVGAGTALDLFTGTTRVAQELKRRGLTVTAVDLASYSKVLADCYVGTDAAGVDLDALDGELARLGALPGRPGYFTRTFCELSRYVQPHNGARVDAIRDAIERDHPDGPLRPLLLTSLLLGTDRVDSTTGLQMAYLKTWSPRSHRELTLLRPGLLAGPGSAVQGDAVRLVGEVPAVDLAYLDPPYNQHRYFTNYHVWETLVRWDEPEHYGIACKRVDARDDPGTRSVFNDRRVMPKALADLIDRVRAQVVVVSYNDESWIAVEEMQRSLRRRHEHVEVLAFDSARYVGARIGIHAPDGRRVGQVRRLRNVEYVFVAGERDRVEPVRALAESRALTG